MNTIKQDIELAQKVIEVLEGQTVGRQLFSLSLCYASVARSFIKEHPKDREEFLKDVSKNLSDTYNIIVEKEK